MKITPLPWPLLLPRLNFTPLYLTPWPLPPMVMGNRGWGPSIKTALCSFPTHIFPDVLPWAVTFHDQLAYEWGLHRLHCGCSTTALSMGCWGISILVPGAPPPLLSPSSPQGWFGGFLEVYLTNLFLTTISAAFLPFLTPAVPDMRPVVGGWIRLEPAVSSWNWLCSCCCQGLGTCTLYSAFFLGMFKTESLSFI